MKKFLGILVLGLLWSNTSFALTDRAICHNGECDFVMGTLYDHAIVNCQWKIKEEHLDMMFEEILQGKLEEIQSET